MLPFKIGQRLDNAGRTGSPRSALQRRVVLAVVALWLVLAVMGLGVLWRYASTPGGEITPLAAWPDRTQIGRDASRPTLVMMLHPQCPCSRASVAELSRLLARSKTLPKTIILCVIPPDAPEAFADTGMIKQAIALPGTTLFMDRAGVEAERFGGNTSGYVLLFDTNGQLMFSGGITSARGHEGDNAGSDAIASLLGGTQPINRISPVFGCALDGPDTRTLPLECFGASGGQN